MPPPIDCSPENREIEDSKQVDRALRCLFGEGQGKFPSAQRILDEVVGNAPEQYVYQYEQGDDLHIKFWDQQDFVHYISFHGESGPGRNIVWMPSAYPRACYYLAFLKIEAGDYEVAIKLLEAGQRLEPTNPKFTLEKAQILGLTGRQHDAISLYDTIRELTPHVSSLDLAHALRGKGCMLIELGDLDQAENCFRASQHYEPDSKLAKSENEYIKYLRSGESPVQSARLVRTGTDPARFETMPPDKNKCANCGSTLQGGKVYNVDGNVFSLCRKCHRKRFARQHPKLTKRWWEFWK